MPSYRHCLTAAAALFPIAAALPCQAELVRDAAVLRNATAAQADNEVVFIPEAAREPVLLAAHHHHRAPARRRLQLAVEREQVRGGQQPRGGLRALDVPPEPERVIGHPRDHDAPPVTTHVSLLPPPWLELTT